MRVRMFRPEFHDKVESGQKRQTIRPIPKRMPKVGDFEAWRGWTGNPYRSRQFNLAFVQLTYVGLIGLQDEMAMSLELDSDVTCYDTDALAKADGFSSWEEMRDWFKSQHGLPFNGILIRAISVQG